MRACVLVLAAAVVSCGGKRPEPTTVSAAPPPWRGAEIGRPAPDFTLADLDGKSWSLRELKGNAVVLEWFNPKCPHVGPPHMKGSLATPEKRHLDKGVVWLAINSAASGKEGFGREENLEGKRRYGIDYPILTDRMGVTGHAYGATDTPQFFVIDRDGTLVYRGAIDNSPDGDGATPASGIFVNYVDAALVALEAGHPVSVKETKPYGCSVRYAR
jgi:Redoxin